MLELEDYMNLVTDSSQAVKEMALEDARNNKNLTFYQFVKIFRAAYPEGADWIGA